MLSEDRTLYTDELVAELCHLRLTLRIAAQRGTLNHDAEAALHRLREMARRSRALHFEHQRWEVQLATLRPD